MAYVNLPAVVGPEYRTTVVAPENRTTVVAPESRTNTVIGHSILGPTRVMAATMTAAMSVPDVPYRLLGSTATATAAMSAPAINTVMYDATGTGASGLVSSTSWTHTISGNAIVVSVVVFQGAPATVSAASVGATPMTQLGSSSYFTVPGPIAILYQFGLLNPPTGTKTISITLAGGPAYTAANSVSYFNVSGFGGSTTNSAALFPTTRSMSLTVGSNPNQMVAQAFSGYAVGISAYNQTSRYYKPFSGGVNIDLLIGDGPGDSIVNFTAIDNESNPWGAVGTPLIPVGGIKVSAPTATVTAAIPTPAAGSNLVTPGTVAAAIPTPAMPIRWPLFDSVGHGNAAVFNTMNWSHTIGANATALIVGLQIFTQAASPTPTVKVGSTNLTQLGYLYGYYYWAGGNAYNHIVLFGMLNPPTGAQTLTVTVAASGGPQITANSVAYAGVSGFGYAATALGSSQDVSVSVSATSAVVQAFGGFTNTFTDYNQTQRYNSPYGPGGTVGFILGDSPGGSPNPTTFSAKTASTPWASIAIPLLPTASPIPPPGKALTVAIPRAATK